MDYKIKSGWVDVPGVDQGVPETMPAYLARPEDSGTFANVIVGFEMFGITHYVRTVTDRLATLGYNAIAPDFYHRLGNRIDLPATAEGRDRGFQLLQQMTRSDVRADAQAVLGYLGERDGSCDRTAVVGFSAGGHIAYYIATQLPLAALVVFYPGWLTDTSIALGRPQPTLELTGGIARFGTRTLFLIGEDDHLYPAAKRLEISDRLRQDEVEHEMVVYPGVPHGFFCHERDTYRPAAAEDALRRVTGVLAEELPCGPLSAPTNKPA